MSAPTLSQAIAAEHARQEAEQGEPVSRGSVVVGLIWSGLLREAERRVREREEQIERLTPPAEHPAVTLLRGLEWCNTGGERACPECGGPYVSDGSGVATVRHDDDCKLAALIKERT